MGEYLPGPRVPEQWEMIGYIEELDKLLARLVEKGPELDPHTKQALRRAVQDYLSMLRIKNGVEVIALRQELDMEIWYIITPLKYPHKGAFLRELLNVVLSENPMHVSGIVPANPRASDVAAYAQYDWQTIQGPDHRYTLDYLYEFGKVMHSAAAYTALFDASEPIAIGQNWRVVEGPHRALVLRVLGSNFVRKSGMDEWIRVEGQRLRP